MRPTRVRSIGTTTTRTTGTTTTVSGWCAPEPCEKLRRNIRYRRTSCSPAKACFFVKKSYASAKKSCAFLLVQEIFIGKPESVFFNVNKRGREI
jgi:hypothetical protein